MSNRLSSELSRSLLDNSIWIKWEMMVSMGTDYKLRGFLEVFLTKVIYKKHSLIGSN